MDHSCRVVHNCRYGRGRVLDHVTLRSHVGPHSAGHDCQCSRLAMVDAFGSFQRKISKRELVSRTLEGYQIFVFANSV
jgi:hypothetical protein